MAKLKGKMSFNERVAIILTQIGGSMPFFWTIAIGYAAWMLWNGFAPKEYRFDGEWFPLLLFISNLIQILYMPILQVGQNLIHKKAESRSASEYIMTKRIEMLMEKLDAMETSQREITAVILSELEAVKEKNR